MDGVLAAITDPTRRRILDLLREQPLTAGAIAKHVPEMSRPAVSQHLAVLRSVGLVEPRRSGRLVVYTLCAAPLQPIWDHWLSRYAELWSDRLLQLKEVVEAQEGCDAQDSHSERDAEGDKGGRRADGC